ncbi:uncharacterized protein LOC123552632 [Mercenaria mercenaria]|uniref:uncharacterized protein LOC123552632 n=1 Tax=Mercenaria mercenaria TaxID=6596 RepID=UPI00234F448F|nr:uncharacterized protein LOC123552632 [Mercenaria mercenaria]XP_053396239.1 uncharacterized protein LOC123552632 [Mercenaria mercenaria]
MNFGSDYVYLYEQPSFEYISDEELEGGMNVSDSDSDSPDEEDADREGAVLFSGTVPPPPPAQAVSSMSGANLFGARIHVDSAPAAPPPPRLPIQMVPKSKPKSHWRMKDTARETAGPIPQSHRRVRQGDTNIVTVKFDKLIAPSNMHAGDPQNCSSCGAILSKISKLDILADEKVWTCEYCETRNVVDIEEEEIPREPDVTFMLEPALSTTASGPTGLDESLVIFCVDVSGSMCVTTEVPGHIELRGASGLRRAQALNRERADQYLPRQRRNVTYISRLQSVQAAIDHQLQEMAREYPNRRVALVTFSNEVTVIGDGKVDPVAIAGDKLGNQDTLKTLAKEQPFPEAIKNTRQQLGQKLFDLEECGPTALGPALLVSATMASKVRGSKVILCTDGLANVGMGKLDNHKNDQELEDAIKFYEEIADNASENGVSISVITIKGTDCKLVEIGKMADKTGGQVNIVDPLKLTQEFSTILANKIIATNVVATFILHKELFFFYEESEESKVVKTIGNVTADTEISFEYGVRTKTKDADKPETESRTGDKEEAKSEGAKQEEKMEVDASGSQEGNKTTENTDIEMEDNRQVIHDEEKQGADGKGQKTETATSSGESMTEGADPFSTAGTSTGPQADEGRKELPFQLQIVYTDTEGAKALRVITQTKPITRDRRKAERNAKVDVLARHTAMTAAKMAQDGMYTMSRERALMNQRVAWRHTREDDAKSKESRPAYKKAFGKIKSMENYLALRQKSERSTHGRTYSDDEDEVEEYDVPLAKCSSASRSKGKSKSFLSKLRKKRSETTEDAGAALVFKGKNARAFFEDSDEETPK